VNPKDVLRYGQRDIDAIVRRIGPEDWGRIALGVWTVKDLLGHLGAYELRFAELLQTFAGEEPATRLRMEPPGTFNDDQAAIRHEWPADRVLAELNDSHALVMRLVELIPAERWREVGTIPWYGAEYSLEDLAVYTQYGHKREHGPQLEADLDAS
jgi:hypothetical protein